MQTPEGYKWNLVFEYDNKTATMKITLDGKLTRSLRYVQGMFFDHNGHIAPQEDVQILTGFLKMLPHR